MTTEARFPRRVIFLCHSPHLTGAQRMLANFMLAMDRRRIEPVVITRAAGPGLAPLEEAGIPCFEAPFTLSLPLLPGAGAARQYLARVQESADALARAIVNLEGDLLLVNTGVVVQGVLAARAAGLPCVVDLRGVMSRGLLPALDTRLLRADEGTLLAAADGLIAHSEWTRSFICETYDVTAQRIRIVHNGIRVPQTVSPLPDGSDGSRRFVMLCTLEANKNVELFLDAAERVVADGRFPDAAFEIYGHGEADYKAALSRRIGSEPLRGRCALHDRTGDVDAVYEGCYAAVVTSHIESFSNVCVEAMAHGRPVISTRCGGPEDIILDGRTGYLIEHSAQELAERMLRLLAEPDRARELGAAGHARAFEAYNLERLVRAYEDVLEETCEAYWSGAACAAGLGARLRPALLDLLSEASEIAIGAQTAPAADEAPGPPAAAERPRPRPRVTALATPAPDGCELAATNPLTAPVRYRVRPARPRWCGLRLLLGTHDRVNTSRLQLSIAAEASPTFVLREAEIACVNLLDNEWHEIRFPPIVDSRGATFVLTLRPVGASPVNAVSVYEWRPPRTSAGLVDKVRRRLSRPAGHLHAELLHDG